MLFVVETSIFIAVVQAY